MLFGVELKTDRKERYRERERERESSCSRMKVVKKSSVVLSLVPQVRLRTFAQESSCNRSE